MFGNDISLFSAPCCLAEFSYALKYYQTVSIAQYGFFSCDIHYYGNWNSSVGSVLGSLSCMMQHRGFDPPLSLQ